MYNFFKYQQTVKASGAQRRSDDLYSQWLLKNQDKKQQAKQKEKIKLNEWVKNNLETGKVKHLEDDHYQQWRFLKQFRDVECQPNFLGYKTFRHKPNHQMDKYFNERERKEIQHSAIKKQHLIDTSLIHQFQRGRSLRSQGPLHPKIQFRPKKFDHEYMNPPMRFNYKSEKQRLSEKTIPMDQKLKSVYLSFEMRKSKIGVARSSFYDGELKGTRSKSNYDRYEIGTTQSFKTKDSKLSDLKQSIELQKTIFPPRVSNNNSEILTESKNFEDSKALADRLSAEGQQPRAKTYWKLAKTMQVQQSDKKLKHLLVQSQYNRLKDLSNIKMNLTCQNFKKKPIL